MDVVYLDVGKNEMTKMLEEMFMGPALSVK